MKEFYVTVQMQILSDNSVERSRNEDGIYDMKNKMTTWHLNTNTYINSLQILAMNGSLADISYYLGY